jgi:hypothetical protein
MNPALKHLSELQAVDLSLNQLRARLAEFPRRFAEVDARLAAARGDVTSAKESLLGSQKDRKKFELDVEQWKESARKYRDQSFQVKTNEAFKALQHEISNAEAEMARAEDRLLERMMAGEEFERRVPAAARALVEAEAATAAERRAIETEKAAAEKELTATKPRVACPKICLRITKKLPCAGTESDSPRCATKVAGSAACASFRTSCKILAAPARKIFFIARHARESFGLPIPPAPLLAQRLALNRRARNAVKISRVPRSRQ